MTNEPPTKTPTLEETQFLAFTRVISPLTFDEFLSKFWDEAFLRVVGYPGKFASLLSWEELNAIFKQ
ncbi:MAG: hypothetical protein ABI618_17465, partial [Nitrospirota bacterium]